MKRTENKGFGLIGIKVELSFPELIVLKQKAESLKALIADMVEMEKKGQVVDPEIGRTIIQLHMFICNLTEGSDGLKEAEESLFGKTKTEEPLKP